MKNTLVKLSFFAGVGLLIANPVTALSQGCSPGYTGYGGEYYEIPSSASIYSSRNYDACSPQQRYYQAPQTYSRNIYRDNYDQGYSPRTVRSNGFAAQGECGCPQCLGNGGVAVNSSSYSDESVNARLSYIEAILSFILNRMGFDDKFSKPKSSSPIPQTRQAPDDNCAGGT